MADFVVTTRTGNEPIYEKVGRYWIDNEVVNLYFDDIQTHATLSAPALHMNILLVGDPVPIYSSDQPPQQIGTATYDGEKTVVWQIGGTPYISILRQIRNSFVNNYKRGAVFLKISILYDTGTASSAATGEFLNPAPV